MDNKNNSSKSNPLVSVVMAVYNGEQFLKEAIDSILAQTYSNFELVIIDDASTDRTPLILQSYTDTRIIRITNQKNLGPYPSANKGLAVARGEFIARHDADDISHPERFRQQVAFLLSNPDVGLLGTSHYVIDRYGRIIDICKPPTTNEQLQNQLRIGNIFNQSSVFFRRNLLEKVGGYRDTFPISQDYDMWLRLAEYSEIANLPDLLSRVRFHSESISRTKRDLQVACGLLARDLALQRRYKGVERPIPADIIGAYPPDPRRIFLSDRYNAYLYFASGQTSQAAEALGHANEILLQLDHVDITWQDWALSKANRIAALRNNLGEGINLIHWVFNTLDLSKEEETIDRLIGRFYADQAFKAYQNGSVENVPVYAWQSMRHDWRWIKNRGLWTISLKSVFRD